MSLALARALEFVVEVGALGEVGGERFFLGEFVFDAEEAAHVAEGLLGGGEFPEVIEPGVLAGAAPGVALADDGADGAVGHAAREGLGGDLEGHSLAGLPEAGGELVREEEGVVTAFGGEGFDGVTCVFPGEPERADVPLAECETVGAGLDDQQLKQLEPCHRNPFCPREFLRIRILRAQGYSLGSADVQ
jgi:hypothetical protein